MFAIKSNPPPAVLTGVFKDAFDVADAVTALIRDGFSEHEIDATGVLCGHAPDLIDVLFSMGVERETKIFYNDCFADGAMLLLSAQNQDTEHGLR